MELIKGAWNGITPRGRTIILVTIIAVVGVTVVLTMAWRYDWAPLINIFAELT